MSGRLLVALAIASLGASGPVACGPAQAARTVSLRLSSSGAPSASVTIDDQFVGTLDFVQSRGVALPPGPHRITVEAPGYLPWDKAVVAREGDPPLRLEVKLVPIPD